jgi:sugar-specific transcriptional regulator TrmB
MDLIDQLIGLGFSAYEARAYVALVKKSPLNGYELARATGIPRANAYSVLDRLEERRAVLRFEGATATQYAPVPPEELMDRLGRDYGRLAASARTELQALAAPTDLTYVWNAKGYQALIDNGRTTARSAHGSLLFAICPPEAGFLAEELRAATERGVKVTTLCIAGCASECGCCVGRVYRHRVITNHQVRWFAAVADHAEVLAGEVISHDEVSAIRTRHKLIVEFASAYICHIIAMATISDDLGGRLDVLISPQARAILQTLGPGGDSAGFLDYMRLLLSNDASRPRGMT